MGSASTGGEESSVGAGAGSDPARGEDTAGATGASVAVTRGSAGIDGGLGGALCTGDSQVSPPRSSTTDAGISASISKVTSVEGDSGSGTSSGAADTTGGGTLERRIVGEREGTFGIGGGTEEERGAGGATEGTFSGDIGMSRPSMSAMLKRSEPAGRSEGAAAGIAGAGGRRAGGKVGRSPSSPTRSVPGGWMRGTSTFCVGICGRPPTRRERVGVIGAGSWSACFSTSVGFARGAAGGFEGVPTPRMVAFMMLSSPGLSTDAPAGGEACGGSMRSGGFAPAPATPRAVARASARAAAEAKPFDASADHALASTASTAAGTSGRSALTDGRTPRRIAADRLASVAPRKAGRPVRHSKATEASAKRSPLGDGR